MIIQNKNYYGLDIQKVEKIYNASYIGDFCGCDGLGDWYDEPMSVFYQEKPNRKLGHTNYFGILVKKKYDILEDFTLQSRYGGTYICNAESAFSKPITGLKMDNGDILVSGYKHDYVEKDGYMIDGGRDYVRCSDKGKLVKLIMREGKLEEITVQGIIDNLNKMEEEYD